MFNTCFSIGFLRPGGTVKLYVSATVELSTSDQKLANILPKSGQHIANIWPKSDHNLANISPTSGQNLVQNPGTPTMYLKPSCRPYSSLFGDVPWEISAC